MSEPPFTDDELLAFLDEQLAVDRATALEGALRTDSTLRQRAALLARRRDQGGHSVGEVWRRGRLSCPSRTELGSWLLDACDDEIADYIAFHLQVVGCRLCAANLEDLRHSHSAAASAQQRQRRHFESSAGRLRRPEG